MNHDEQAIRDLVALWHRATAADDVDTVLGLIAEDAVFLVAGRPPMIGRGTFERGLRELLTEHRIESTHRIRELEIGADLAYCWTELSVRILPRTGSTGGAAETHGGSALSILRKQRDGRWLLIRDANLLGTARQ
ncbi:MAG: SgcJ/EcaC family oxidoreductase [Caldimonas sp.]